MAKPLHSMNVPAFARDTLEAVILGLFAGLILGELVLVTLGLLGKLS